MFAVASATVTILVAGCASIPSPDGPDASEQAAETRVESAVFEDWLASAGVGLPNEQHLFRAQIEGEEGQASVRLTLRTVSDGMFEIDAHDTFGRAVWGLLFDGEAGVVTDHRRRIYCRYGAEVSLPDASLRELPLTSLPRVLLAYVPVPPVGEITMLSSDRAEYRDEDGGRWRVRWSNSALAAWTYFGVGERPIVWWSRDDKGDAVLSHRDGTQLRWTETVSEVFVGEIELGSSPPGYVECES